MALAGLVLLAVAYGGLAWSRAVAALRAFARTPARGGLLIGVLLVPCLLVWLPEAAADPAGFLGAVGRLAVYLLVPGVLLLVRPARATPLDAFDAGAILALWLPVEFDWLPEASVRLAEGVSLPAALLTAICLGFLLVRVIRPLPGVGYSYRLGGKDVGQALLALAAYAAVGLPLGVALGFIEFGVAAFDAGEWVVTLLAIYFLTAISEELLFRGAIQNLLEQRFGRSAVTWLGAAVVFGLSHVNNVTAHHRPPNWPYVAMATLAGLAYGWVWQRTGKITASAITHTLVNFVWGVIFQS
jgi:membrane protease YdiL (CAAX protease family)